MNKNWLIVIFAFLLIVEYKSGVKRSYIVDDNFKIKRPTTVIRIGPHKKYIDMRNVKNVYKISLNEM